MYDFIVIGAGYAGLSAAALLAKAGLKILLLESHTVAGGCASYFKRKEFIFDVGATTFSGVLPHQPVGKLFAELGISPNLKKIDPGMIIRMNGKEIVRFAEKDKWIEEASRKFGPNNQKEFWEKVFDINEKVWMFIYENETLPSSNIKDFSKLLKIKNLNYLTLLPLLKKSVEEYAGKYINQNHFKRFLDEQLLITTQNLSSEAPMLTGAVGLAYPSETYYPVGGMRKPAELILEKFLEIGGEIKFKEEVINIAASKECYIVKTKRGNVYKASGIISSIPIWNLPPITEGGIQNYFQKYSEKFSSAPGAFVINFALENSSELDSLYYQLHSKEKIPFAYSGSVFVSFSHKADSEKAPTGFRTVTISTHTDSKNWLGVSKEKYEKRKSITSKFILKIFDEEFPHLSKKEKLFLMSGTPKSFQFYTKRFNGFVGGIPHSIARTLLSLPPNTTPFKNFYCVGDTTFPGQGTPSVILGALNTAQKIKNNLE